MLHSLIVFTFLTIVELSDPELNSKVSGNHQVRIHLLCCCSIRGRNMSVSVFGHIDMLPPAVFSLVTMEITRAKLSVCTRRRWAKCCLCNATFNVCRGWEKKWELEHGRMICIVRVILNVQVLTFSSWLVIIKCFIIALFQCFTSSSNSILIWNVLFLKCLHWHNISGLI